MGIFQELLPLKVNYIGEARVQFPSQKNQKEVRNYGVVTPRGNN